MRQFAASVVTAVCVLLGGMGLALAQTGGSVEDIMKKEGLMTEQEYEAAKEAKLEAADQDYLFDESLADEQQHKEEWEIGAEISHVTYKEPGIMEETGMMYGITGSGALHNKYMLKAEGKLSFGQVDYDGELDDGTPYNIDNIDDFMLELRGLGGYDFSVSEKVRITPYVGLGYRYLNDDPSFDVYGYERESNYFYSPVGVEALMGLKNGWSLGATAEFDIFWAGVQRSHLSDVAAGLSDVDNDQDEGYGVRGSIKVLKEGDKFDFIIEPFIRYWDIDKSEITAITYNGHYIGYGYEPKNNSTEIGCKLAVKF